MAVAALLLLVVTACRNVETTVKVKDDRTATVTLLVVPSLRNLEELGGKEEFSRLVAQFDNPAVGISAKEVAVPVGMGMQVTVEARSLDELSRPFPLPSPPAPPGASLQLFDSFQVVYRNGTWRLDAVARPVPQLTAGLPALDGRLEGARYDINVELPGRYEFSNGDEDNGRGTWTVQGSQPLRLEMRTADQGPLSPLLLAVVGAVVLILIGLVLASRGKDAATAANIRKQSKRVLGRRKAAAGTWEDAAQTSLPSGSTVPVAPTLAVAPGVLHAEVEQSADGRVQPVPAAPVTPPGWYADPEDQSRQRFWDGAVWTEHRS